MSLVKTYSVFCDANVVCVGDWVAETTDGGKEARRVARAHGWKRIDGQDWCPACFATTRGAQELATSTAPEDETGSS